MTMVTVVVYFKSRKEPLFSVLIATSDFEESRTLKGPFLTLIEVVVHLLTCGFLQV